MIAARARPVVRACRNPARTPWPRRHGWAASDTDILLAQHAQWEFATQRRVIVLVPADPMDARNQYGRKLRVCTSTTPRWYQTLIYRRPQKPRRVRQTIRLYVQRALAHLCATRYIRPAPWAMDVELLEVLYDHFEAPAWGYPDWGGGLRLRANPYAARYRAHRRQRDGRA